MEPTARGFHSKIAPSTRSATREAQSASGQSLSSLRDELIRIFQNPTNLEDDSLFIEVPTDQQRHNNLSTPSSPFTLPTDTQSPHDSLPSVTNWDSLESASDPVSVTALSLQQSSYASVAPSPIFPTQSVYHNPPPKTNLVALPTQNYAMASIPANAAAQPAVAPQIYFPIPGRGERGAPTVDIRKPRQLIQIFKELKPLFVRGNITSEQDKKDMVLKYVDLELEEVWQRYPEYKTQTTTYAAFKAAILAHYPDATGDYMYSLADIDSLIGERYRIGIRTLDDLTDYHNRFEAITSWLREKDHIGKKEEERYYVGAFQPHFWDLIENRLSIKYMNQHPNEPYPIVDVYDAARSILQGSYRGAKRVFAQVADQTPASSSVPTTQNTVVSEPAIKVEAFGALISEFTKTMAEILNQTRNRGNYSSSSRNVDCNMCGGPHYIKDCEVVDEFIAAGKARRNLEGKVVLSTGAYVPRDIPGTLLQDRINEWHRRNPGQLAAATLVHTIDKSLLYAPQSSYQLSSSDRIAHLEAEIYALKARRSNFVPIARTRAQTARNARVEFSDDEDETPPKAQKKAPTSKTNVVPSAKEKEKVAEPETTIANKPLPSIVDLEEPEEEHPFRGAKDAVYAPPTSRNVGAPIPHVTKKSEPAYKTQPAIYKPSIATDVYSRTMDTPITVTQRELLSLSPEVRAQIREATTTRRVAVQNTQEPVDESANFLQVENSDEEDKAEIPAVPTFAIPKSQHRVPPEGAIVIPDPIETYIRSLPTGTHPDPDRLVVACENSAVRSVFALVDNNRKKECILDSGCQVVTISKAVSHELAIAYDPTFRISMQSANGELDMSLGLARNVPFKIGPVTFYMQAHVIDSNAYDVLLGRPFDVLTESVIRNFANEDQTITIHDPNTGQHVTVPTLARGAHKADPTSVEDF